MGPTRKIATPRTRGATIGAAVLAGACLAALQPLPWALLLRLNDAVAPDPNRWSPTRAFGYFWGAPYRWAAVAAYTVTLAVMLARVGRPTGGYVGAALAASVSAYTLVGAVGLALTGGGGAGTVVGDIALSVSPYGTIWLAAALTVATCWWARGFT